MKKLFAIILMVVMICAMTVSASAAPGAFIASPSYNKAPIIIEFECSDSNWKGEIYITSFGDRNVLELIDRELLEDAYESIRNSGSISALIPEISDIAANLNVSPDNLGISDLFHIGVSDSTDGTFKIKLDSETIKHFVGLVYYENGKWHVVEDARVEGGYLVFTSQLPKAFAVVVDTTNLPVDAPVTGDIVPWALMAVMVVSAAGIVLAVITYKKKSRV